MKIKRLLLGAVAMIALCTAAPLVASAKTEQTLEITGELRRSEQKIVVLHKADGTIEKRKPDKKGKVTLPTIKNEEGYTFLGWSLKPGQRKNPKYQAGEAIRVKTTIHLYAVMYCWEQEPDIRVKNLANAQSKYSRIIFVGDSRTYFLKKTLLKEYGKSAVSNLSFVCQPGKGLKWLQNTGEALLQQEIAQVQESGETKPIAVIFNLGVNDLSTHGLDTVVDPKKVAKKYISYMNKLGKQLSAENCKLFYMSVNPANTAMKPTRQEAHLRYFNDTLRADLDNRFQWIDTYQYLMKNGYSTYHSFRNDIDDGLHYSLRTYKRIYKYCMTFIGQN